MSFIDVFELLIPKKYHKEKCIINLETTFGKTTEKYLVVEKQILGKITEIQPVHDYFIKKPKDFFIVTLVYQSSYNEVHEKPAYDLFKNKIFDYLENKDSYAVIFEIDCDQYPWEEIDNNQNYIKMKIEEIGQYIQGNMMENKAIFYCKNMEKYKGKILITTAST